MSDYISKQVTMQRFLKEIEQFRSDCIHINTIKRLLDDVDTLDEKEIIRKVFERVLERLEEEQKGYICDEDDYCEGAYNAYRDSISTVKEVGGIE